jgi:hypothetical protein
MTLMPQWGWFSYPKNEGWPIQVLKVAWCSEHLITFIHAIFFMIYTKDEVSTCVFWLVHYTVAFENDVHGLRDEWDGFSF